MTESLCLSSEEEEQKQWEWEIASSAKRTSFKGLQVSGMADNYLSLSGRRWERGERASNNLTV